MKKCLVCGLMLVALGSAGCGAKVGPVPPGVGAGATQGGGGASAPLGGYSGAYGTQLPLPSPAMPAPIRVEPIVPNLSPPASVPAAP